jgi:hypothetical protein
MRIKVLAVFGLSYAVMLAGGLALSLVAMRILAWDDANHTATNNIGFIVNMLAFFVAITAATSRKLHIRLGGAPGPIAFRVTLAQLRSGLAVGIALLATGVDLCIYAVSSWYFTGEMLLPSPLRAAALAVVYGVLAWLTVSNNGAKDQGYGQR